MSFNELQWWQAYSACRPLEPKRLDILEARSMTAFSGESADKYVINWFDINKDPDYKKEQDKKLFDELTEMKAQRNNGEKN